MKKSIMSGLIAAAAAIMLCGCESAPAAEFQPAFEKAQRQFRRQPSPRRYLKL